MGRRLLMVAAAVVIGAVFNVVVAWSGAAMTDLGAGRALEFYTDLGAGNHWEVYRWDTFTGSRVFSRCWHGAPPGPHNPGDPAELLPGWADIEPPDRETPQIATIVNEAWGVPMRSMRCGAVSRRTSTGTTEKSKVRVLQVRSPQHAGSGGVYLPLVPSWPGFAVNTIAYALLVAVAAAVTRDTVRAIRRRRLAAADAP